MSAKGLPNATARVATATIRMVRIAAGPSVQPGGAPAFGRAASAPPADCTLGAGAFGEDGKAVIADFGEAARDGDGFGCGAGGLIDLQLAILEHGHDRGMAGHGAELA